MYLSGLLNLLTERTSIVAQVIYPLISGIGIGMLFHAPYQVFARALKPQELATGTSAFFLVRFTGATVGLVGVHSSLLQLSAKSKAKAIAGTIFYADSSSRLPPDLGANNSSSIDYSAIKYLPEPIKEDILRILSRSIRVCAPLLPWTKACSRI